jgi:branched-chain amino acid transport system permease protein
VLILQLIVNALAVGSIYAVTALSFEIAYESTGVVNFSTGQLVTAGALIGASASHVFPQGAALGAVAPFAYVVVILAMAALGLLFFVGAYLPLRSRPVLTIIIGTVAVGIVVQNVSLMVWGPLPIATPSPVGGGTLHLAGVVLPLHALFVIAVTTLLIMAVYVLLYRSPLGTQFRALAQDPEAARLIGVRVNWLYALTWKLACALAGIAGLLLSPMWFIDVGMGDSLALKAFAAAIIGGFGSIPGAIVGGISVGLAEVLGASYISSSYKDAIVFALMILFLLFRPQGLFGERVAERG